MKSIWTEEIVKEKILQVMSIFNVDYMPTSSQVRQSKISGLENAISRTGGYIYWTEKLNLSSKRPVLIKSEKDIENDIYQIINEFNLNRMPNKKEVEQFCSNENLHNAIVRSYGYYGWANKLNLEIKNSETLMGINYQDICFKHLESLGYDVEHTTTKAPYDLVVNKNIRIDVKSGSAYYLKDSRVHTFGINKSLPVCDLYTIYALVEKGIDIERIFIIPSKNLKIQSLSIGANSKYNKYINRWDLVKQYENFYNTLY